MEKIFRLEHPLADHYLARIRARQTPPAEFRQLVERLTVLLVCEATRDFKLRETTLETPLQKTTGRVLNQRIGLLPILRAGLGMVKPALDLIPEAEVWHLGFYRNEETLEPVEYYKKLPPDDPVDVALVLDPMLATGGSALAAIHAAAAWGVPVVKLLSIIASPEGINAVRETSPQTSLYMCSIDEGLNDRGYIVPGLGDAGDRIFNAKAL